MSDDIDIYAEDIPIAQIAKRDVAALRAAGFHAKVDDQFYGYVVEAIITRSPESVEGTKLEWTEADRRRFYPIQTNKTFGWTLHKTDLAVQKLIAAASRRKARDALDVLLIDHGYAPLAALAIAAPAKLETASPVAILERILQNGNEHPMDDYLALRIDGDAMPFPIREIKMRLADKINATIDIIIASCPNAEPANIYLARGNDRPQIPTNNVLPNLFKHGITSKGTVPIFRSITRSIHEIGD